MLRRISAMAIFSGFAASFLVGLLVTFLGTFAALGLGLAQDVALEDFAESVSFDPTLVSVSLVASLSSALAAGYVAAWTAPGDERENSLAIGILLVALGALFFEPFGLDQYPLWYTFSAFVFTIPLSVLGGILRRGPP